MKNKNKIIPTISFVAHPSRIVECLHYTKIQGSRAYTLSSYEERLVDRTGRNMPFQQC
jgi:hypothetical protein